MYDFLDKIGLKAVLEAIKGKIPTSLPANGGNADTVDEYHVSDIIYSSASKPPQYFIDVARINPETKRIERWNTDNIKVALADRATNVENADMVDGKHASDFYQIAGGLRAYVSYNDIFSTTLSSSHACWNKWCYAVGNSTDTSISDYIINAPESSVALWYEVFTGGAESRAFQIAIGCFTHQRKTFIRYMHDGVWSGWYNIADGGNSNTVNGHTVNTDVPNIAFSQTLNSGHSATSDLNDGTYYCANWTDYPSNAVDAQGTLIVTNYATSNTYPWSHRTFYSPHSPKIWHGFTANGVWFGWNEISTTLIKSEEFTASTDSWSHIQLFSTSENKKPLAVTFTNTPRTYSVFSHDGYCYLELYNNSMQTIPNTSVSFVLYYMEV